MVRVDLVTGFLGAGKTTFLRRYVPYLLEQGEKVCILENDYGAVNVDMMLLSDLKSDRVGIEMVAGGCDYDCHRRRFKTKLITMAMLGYTRVLIEPSGVFDVDEFFDILHEDPLDTRYEIANVIAIVKADLPEEASTETDYMLASQCADAGAVVLSRVRETDPETVKATVDHIGRALAGIRCRRTFSLDKNVIAKDWAELTGEDWRKIASCGYTESAYEKRFSMDENGFQSLFFMNCALTAEEAEEAAKKLFTDKSVGHVIRVKGFLPDGKGGFLELNATEEGIEVKPIHDGQEILIVIGEELKEEAVDACFPARWSTTHVR